MRCSMGTLFQRLSSLDGKGYGAYKSIAGRHALEGISGAELFLDKVQSDPFAPASLSRVRVPLAALPFSGSLSTHQRDLLNRRIAGEFCHGLAIDCPGQQVLSRAAVTQLDDALQICFEVQLPARGLRIRGREAAQLLCTTLPRALDRALCITVGGDALRAELEAAAELERDQAALRGALAGAGLVAFIADGSILPRQAGNSDEPKSHAIPFVAPESLAHEFTLPSGRIVRGMGIPQGVTLIVGGGYHGKSTLLSALVTGVYDHVAGDGRELVVADPTAVALRAEDGRAITGVDISSFINGLPSGERTTSFSTTNASGSTSQSAALMEALEAGAHTLLIDEDTSATNFMIRDDRMRRLVPADREPITPLVGRARELWRDHGISTVVVAGGSGAFIDIADTVIAMDAYTPHDVTTQAQQLIDATPTAPALAPMAWPAPRVAARVRTQRDQRGRTPKLPRARGIDTIQHGRDDIDLRAISQLACSSQTQAIARIIATLEKRADGHTPMITLVNDVLAEIQTHGWAALSGQRAGSHAERHPGRVAMPRPQEVMAALNRYRRLSLVGSLGA
ncbi:ABC-ATPase domain-containing protein [Corynebacterium diphtheriae]|uniref:ABC-ATPase domain-containing protein n=1 Tax=Corynebacterium diphtheriae TaxID=1717 RepID=UPI000B4BA5B7|nr:ABC-ATPase domain-containing protein [Corynebacterium diphtheriae]OWN62110.1 ATPase [Corynebacterium diphtheriae bv. gravis]